MALFKIEKGLSATLAANRPNTIEGQCYFTTDDGKFYIDINTQTKDLSGRIAINAAKADIATSLEKQLTLNLTGAVTGSVTFNGDEETINLATSVGSINLDYLPLAGGTVTGITTFSNTTDSTSLTTGAVVITGGLGVSKAIRGNTVHGAVWNDYAEYRETTEVIEAGRVVIENGDDTLSLSTERLQPAANIVSDTFGFSIGETETAKTPLAVAGRVLAYPYEERENFKPGDAVCSGPNGTVSKMSRGELALFPDRILGFVSSVPSYDTWGTGNVAVNGRIWIKVK